MQKTIVIIPCFNESLRLDIKKFEEFLKNNSSIFLFFADDGSTDNTSEIILDLTKKHNNGLFLQFEVNQGKAETVRKTILHIIENYEFQNIGYFDADLSTSLDYIVKFQDILNDNNKLMMVSGSRIKRLGSEISRSTLRHFFGRVVATFASRILSLPVYDTQCGSKLFKSHFIIDIFTDPFLSKWLFDIEVFARLKKKYQQEVITRSILEYPLEKWIDEGNSKIKFIDFIKVPKDLVKIALKYAN